MLHSRVAEAFAIVFVFLTILADRAAGDPQAHCSRTCIAANCRKLGIRYGKYCGLGYSGCRGEPPCDDLDACCRIHDECVGKNGMTYVKCHKQFIRCVNRVKRSKKVGFSMECPYEIAIPTMKRGMELGILLSETGNLLGPKEGPANLLASTLDDHDKEALLQIEV